MKAKKPHSILPRGNTVTKWETLHHPRAIVMDVTKQERVIKSLPTFRTMIHKKDVSCVRRTWERLQIIFDLVLTV